MPHISMLRCYTSLTMQMLHTLLDIRQLRPACIIPAMTLQTADVLMTPLTVQEAHVWTALYR